MQQSLKGLLQKQACHDYTCKYTHVSSHMDIRGTGMMMIKMGFTVPFSNSQTNFRTTIQQDIIVMVNIITSIITVIVIFRVCLYGYMYKIYTTFI